jgi:hypothetical protein
MTDEMLRRMQQDWQSQEYDAGAVVQRLRRQRWTPHWVLALELLGCACALGTGVWFAWTAAQGHEHRLLFAVSALILVISAPVLGIASVLARRQSLAWEDETPESILRIGIRRAEATLRAIAIGRWHLAVIGGFVVVLWILQALGFIAAAGFLVFYTLVCAVVSLAWWLWMRSRTRTANAEREACLRLLSSLRAGDAEA